MTTPERVQGIVQRALAAPDAETRNALLDRECGTESELRTQIERLLWEHAGLVATSPLFAPSSLDRGVTIPRGGEALPPAKPSDAVTGSHTPAEQLSDGSTVVRSNAISDLGDVTSARPVSADPSFDGAPVVAGYDFEREIARGGMGVVYAARDRAFGREVAVKVMLPGMSAATFDREARITARLPHPGIPPVHALGTLPDGRPFLAMKLIRGDTLKDLLEVRAEATADRARLLVAFEQMCQAVGYAHAQGIIHRDLKPANVMVGAFGEVQVMDWGLAREVRTAEFGPRNDETSDSAIPSSEFRGPHSQETVAGQVKGTPAYMAPEQARGEPVDARADVFALGGILTAILTGKPPFAGNGALDTILRAAQAELSDAFVRLDASGADAELVSLCKRCLAAQADDRFADGARLADAVAAYRANVEDRLRKAEADRARRDAQIVEQRRRRRWQGAVAAVLVLLVAVGATFAWYKRDTDQKARVAEAEYDAESARNRAQLAQEETARLKAEEAVRVRQAQNRIALADVLEKVRAELRAGDATRVEPLLAQAQKRFDEGGVEEFREPCAACARELHMLKALDLIDLSHWIWLEDEKDDRLSDAERYAAAFAEYGIVPGSTPPEQVAKRLDESLIGDRLRSGLDVWLVAHKSDRKLRALLATVDPDPFRTRTRETNYTRALTERTAGGDTSRPVLPLWFAVAQGLDITLGTEVREQLLTEVYPQYPNNLQLLVGLSAIPNPRREPQLAERCAGWARAALVMDARNPGAWNNLGIALASLERPQEALAALQQAVKWAPEEATIHHNLAEVYSRLGNYQEAIAADRTAVKLNPGYVLAWLKLADTFLTKPKPNPKSAEEALQEAMKLEPNSVRVNAQVAQLRLFQKRPEDALATFQQAVKEDPDSVAYRTAFAAVLTELQRWDEVIAQADEVLARDPKSGAAYYFKGHAIAAKGDRVRAIPLLRKAVQLEPTRRVAHDELGLALIQQGELEEATEVLQRAVQLRPTHYKAHLLLGRAYSLRKMYPEAVAACGTATKFPDKQNRAVAYMLLADALRASGKGKESLDALKTAAELDPKKFGPLWEKVQQPNRPKK